MFLPFMYLFIADICNMTKARLYLFFSRKSHILYYPKDTFCDSGKKLIITLRNSIFGFYGYTLVPT